MYILKTATNKMTYDGQDYRTELNIKAGNKQDYGNNDG